MLKKMYMIDFNEPCLKDADPVTKRLKVISYEHKRFLKILQKEILKVGKHHQLPSLLRNKNMNLPNNWNMVEKMLMHLERQFQKDFKFCEDYNKFMEEITSRGYAREAETNPSDGRTWYLPHHGVYHPRKPSRLKVVFECNAELNGRSINKELLPCPDLGNKLVCILTKFRENKVAFMADIEKMYFQIFVVVQHRSLLRFLWWKKRKYLRQANWLWNVCPCIWRCFIWSLQQSHSENNNNWEQGEIWWRSCSSLAKQLFCGQPVKVSGKWRHVSSVNKEGYRNVPWRRLQLDKVYKQQQKGSAINKTDGQMLRTKIL